MPDNEETRRDLEAVVRSMVDRPEEVTIGAVAMRRATIFEVRSDPDDLGKVIGRRGRAARALRTLLDCRGDVEGAQYGLEILDE